MVTTASPDPKVARVSAPMKSASTTSTVTSTAPAWTAPVPTPVTAGGRVPGPSRRVETMSDDLVSRFGSAKHPERPVVHPRPDDVDDATVAAAGKVSKALEVVEAARGFLYQFHRMSGTADLTLQEAVSELREAGHGALADEIDQVLVGRDVIAGRWTFQVVEDYDDGYYRVFRAVDEKVRGLLSDGKRHVHEAEMKHAEQQG